MPMVTAPRGPTIWCAAAYTASRPVAIPKRHTTAIAYPAFCGRPLPSRQGHFGTRERLESGHSARIDQTGPQQSP